MNRKRAQEALKLPVIVGCPLCEWKRRVPELAQVASRYLVHFVDDHWDFLERVHATTGDDDARLRLNAEIAEELGRS